MRSVIIFLVTLIVLPGSVYAERPFNWSDTGSDIINRYGEPKDYNHKNFRGSAMGVIPSGLNRVSQGESCRIHSITYNPWVGPLDYWSFTTTFSFDVSTCRLARVEYWSINDSKMNGRNAGGESSGKVFLDLESKLIEKYGQPQHMTEKDNPDKYAFSAWLKNREEKLDAGYLSVSRGWEVTDENLLIVLKISPGEVSALRPTVSLHYIRVDRSDGRDNEESQDSGEDNDL